MGNVEEPEWPTHCEYCEHELESGVVDVVPGGDEVLATVVAQDFCPNPDCPGKVSDLGPAADPVQGERLNQAVEGHSRPSGGVTNGG